MIYTKYEYDHFFVQAIKRTNHWHHNIDRLVDEIYIPTGLQKFISYQIQILHGYISILQ